jgi:hypothetical protein
VADGEGSIEGDSVGNGEAVSDCETVSVGVCVTVSVGDGVTVSDWLQAPKDKAIITVSRIIDIFAVIRLCVLCIFLT